MTMTPERLAELDAVMAKATAGEWAYKPQDYDDWGTIRAAPESEGRSYIVAVSRGNGQQDHKVHRELGTDPYEPNGRAIVALHNAYPDLRAHIDEQAATIEKLLMAIRSAVDDFQLVVERIDDNQIDRAKGTAMAGERAATRTVLTATGAA